MSEKEKDEPGRDGGEGERDQTRQGGKGQEVRQGKKPGFFKPVGRFFRELKAELKKVAWPTRADTLKNTGIVIVCASSS